MNLKDIANQIGSEIRAAKGEKSKDREFSSQQKFPNQTTANEAFALAVQKLLNVNGWSGLSTFTADFALHDPAGRPKDGPVETGDYIQIILPGPLAENWVQVTHQSIGDEVAEFTVQPCANPRKDKPAQTEHFFTKDAQSTFRVELNDLTLNAFEIGQNEFINNQGSEAGDRTVVNTLIAETGWLFYQRLQWKFLTDYLVHL